MPFGHLRIIKKNIINKLLLLLLFIKGIFFSLILSRGSEIINAIKSSLCKREEAQVEVTLECRVV